VSRRRKAPAESRDTREAPKQKPHPLSLEEIERLAKDSPGLDARSLLAYNELTRTHRAFVSVLDRAATDNGLSVGRNLVLWVISQSDQTTGVTPAEIARIADVTRATVTGLLNSLERDGLIVRSRSTADRRQVHVLLSPNARRVIKAAWPKQSEQITRVMSTLTDREKTVLVDILRKIRHGIRELVEDRKQRAAGHDRPAR
jgi:DNA-binding MarR family transcriptional regulator